MKSQVSRAWALAVLLLTLIACQKKETNQLQVAPPSAPPAPTANLPVVPPPSLPAPTPSPPVPTPIIPTATQSTTEGPISLDLSDPDLPPIPINSTLKRGWAAVDLGQLAERRVGDTPYLLNGCIKSLPAGSKLIIKCEILTNKWWPQFDGPVDQDGCFSGTIYLSTARVPTTIKWRLFEPDSRTGSERRRVGEFFLRIQS